MIIREAAWAAALPAGTRVVSPGMITFRAEKVADCFRGGRSGWRVNGITAPVSDDLLFLYSQFWETTGSTT